MLQACLDGDKIANESTADACLHMFPQSVNPTVMAIIQASNVQPTHLALVNGNHSDWLNRNPLLLMTLFGVEDNSAGNVTCNMNSQEPTTSIETIVLEMAQFTTLVG